jgi:hypothetical protein
VSNTAVFEDAFNLLCGDKLGEGIHRTVFECRVRPDLVVKAETHQLHRYFANVMEMKFWSDNEHDPNVARWLAPCRYLSPDGRILLQERAESLPASYRLPARLPAFLTDIKRSNFGLIKRRLVCVDYAYVIVRPAIRPRKAEWSD